MKNLKWLTIISAFLLAVAAAGCGRMEERTDTLGYAGEATVSPEELRIYLAEEMKGSLDSLDLEQKKLSVKRLLVRKNLADEAVRQGLEESEKVKKGLLGWKMRTYPDYFWKYRVREKVSISEEEARNYLQPQESFHLAVITLPGSDEGKEEAWEVHEELGEGADFASLARERSFGFSGPKGGDLGYQEIPNSMIEANAADAIKALEPGQYSEPVETSVGWVIYLLKAYRSVDEDFRRGEERARLELLEVKVREEKVLLMDKLRSDASITYHGVQEGQEGVPLAVVNGFAIMPQSLGDLPHGTKLEIVTPKDKLDRFVDTFLVVSEMEKEGLEHYGDLGKRLWVVRTSALSSVAIEESIKDRITPSEQEIEEEYKRFYRPDIYRLQIVLTSSETEALEAFDRLEGGDSFADVAKKYNAGRLKGSGGRVEFMPLSDFPEQIQEAVEGLEDGDYTPVIGAAGGRYYILKRVEKREIAVPALEDVSSSIRKKLTLLKKSEAVKSFMEEYLSRLEVRIDEDNLRRL